METTHHQKDLQKQYIQKLQMLKLYIEDYIDRQKLNAMMGELKL